MPALASSDVTVTVTERRQGNRKRYSRCTVAFGDGAKTYPSGGVPLPAHGAFGLQRTLDYLTLIDGGSASGLTWKYDATNKKLRAYRSAGFTATVPVTGGGAGADAITADSGALKKAAAGNYNVNANAVAAASLVELTTSDAPAAQSFVVEAQGW